MIALNSCLLNPMKEKKELQTKNTCTLSFIFTCVVTFVGVFISSCGFELLSSVLSFHPEILLSFLLLWENTRNIDFTIRTIQFSSI